jgi:uncharacterized membrane protein YeiH
VPVVLREDFYATPAVVGGVAFRIAVESGGVAPDAALLPSAGLVLAVRLVALRRGWRLPRP